MMSWETAMVSTPVRKREVEDLDTRDQLLCLTVIGKDLLSLNNQYNMDVVF